MREGRPKRIQIVCIYAKEIWKLAKLTSLHIILGDKNIKSNDYPESHFIISSRWEKIMIGRHTVNGVFRGAENILFTDLGYNYISM